MLWDCSTCKILKQTGGQVTELKKKIQGLKEQTYQQSVELQITNQEKQELEEQLNKLQEYKEQTQEEIHKLQEELSRVSKFNILNHDIIKYKWCFLLTLNSSSDLLIPSTPDILGEGSFSKVVKAKYLHFDVAVKMYNVSSTVTIDVQRQKELNAMKYWH